MESILLLVGAVIVGLILLSLAFVLFSYLVVGAVSLFEWASESGFLGVAAYFASWIFMLPFMLIGCVIFGFLIEYKEKQFFARLAERSRLNRLENTTVNTETDVDSQPDLYEEPLSEYEKKRGY